MPAISIEKKDAMHEDRVATMTVLRLLVSDVVQAWSTDASLPRDTPLHHAVFAALFQSLQSNLALHQSKAAEKVCA